MSLVFGLWYDYVRDCAKDKMQLYQHSARCPVAMQIFLNANPRYWRFVPMTEEEAEKPDQKYIRHPTAGKATAMRIREKQQAFDCIEKLPVPPEGFCFSNRQLLKQFEYFRDCGDSNMPNRNVDLYNATIVAVSK